MHEKRITNKDQLKEWLDYELPFYGNGGLKYYFQLGEKAILRRHQILLRKMEFYLNTKKKIRALFCRALLSRMQTKYSLYIPPNVCGKGLRIMHLGPVLINGKSIVGENCKFHMNSALVAGGNTSEAPVLGDNVVVGYGAVVVGGVCIADYVAIGANAVVNKDVLETNIAVAGVPAKKISNNGSKTWGVKSN